MATAAEETAKAFITLLNPQAVRVVLPDLLAALDTKKNWQTKIAALQALSELCKRAPLQTSVCLPDAIPVVTSIMGDAKPQVKVRLCSLCRDRLVLPVSQSTPGFLSQLCSPFLVKSGTAGPPSSCLTDACMCCITLSCSMTG